MASGILRIHSKIGFTIVSEIFNLLVWKRAAEVAAGWRAVLRAGLKAGWRTE